MSLILQMFGVVISVKFDKHRKQQQQQQNTTISPIGKSEE